jgi:hypothetical protein
MLQDCSSASLKIPKAANKTRKLLQFRYEFQLNLRHHAARSITDVIPPGGEMLPMHLSDE